MPLLKLLKHTFNESWSPCNMHMDGHLCPTIPTAVAVLKRIETENYDVTAHCIVSALEPESKRLLKTQTHTWKSVWKRGWFGILQYLYGLVLWGDQYPPMLLIPRREISAQNILQYSCLVRKSFYFWKNMYCLSTSSFSPKDQRKKSVYRSSWKLFFLWSCNFHTCLVSHLLQMDYSTGNIKLCLNRDLTRKVSDEQCFRIVACTAFKLSYPTKNIL